MFVGMEGVGKTTLFKKLRGYDTKSAESILLIIQHHYNLLLSFDISTNGVDIGEWSILVKNAKERLPQLNKKLKNDPKSPIEDQISVQFSVWDFGGQVNR